MTRIFYVRHAEPNYNKHDDAILVVDFAIEMLQFLFRIGSVDIDDVILNMVGVILGYVVWKTIVSKLFTKMKVINP